jgi:hypothetical protein
MPFKSFKDLSKIEWGKEYCGSDAQAPSDWQLHLGFMERITEAVERLASGRAQLDTLKELEEAKIDKGILQRERDYARRQAVAYKGHVTRLKREV